MLVGFRVPFLDSKSFGCTHDNHFEYEWGRDFTDRVGLPSGKTLSTTEASRSRFLLHWYVLRHFRHTSRWLLNCNTQIDGIHVPRPLLFVTKEKIMTDGCVEWINIRNNDDCNFKNKPTITHTPTGKHLRSHTFTSHISKSQMYDILLGRSRKCNERIKRSKTN